MNTTQERKPETNEEQSQPSKSKFKITKHHLQGAVAMLLVCVMTISAVGITNGNWPFGTTFKGYEDAQEMPLQIEADTIEARADFTEQAFTVTGLPEDELAAIKPEHVFLGGYFADKSVKNIEASETALLVTVSPEAPVNDDSDEVDWENYLGGDGIIAVSPEAFKDKSYYYQGIVPVIYPELVSETEAIEQDYDGNVSQSITLTLKNDSFTGSLTAEDLEISGGFESVKAENLTQSENSITFTLTGKTDGNFGSAYFDISGDSLEKGLNVKFSAGIGRVPMPYQVGSLCVMNDDTQTLEIFLDYDSFDKDIRLSMLTFGGVMESFEVTGFELVNTMTVRLTLKGRPQAGTGTVRFDSSAVTSGRSGRVCEITVGEPDLIVEQDVPSDRKDPSFMVQFAGIPGLKEGDVRFTLDGALGGLTITDLYWTMDTVTVYTRGTAGKGEGVIRVTGLYEAETRFEVTDERTSTIAATAQTIATGGSPVQTLGMDMTANSVEAAPVVMVELLTAKGFFGAVAKGIGVGVAKKAGSKVFDEVLGALGMGDPSTGEVLDAVLKELDKMQAQAKTNTDVIMARLDKIDYDITSEAVGDIHNSIKEYYNEFVRMEGEGGLSEDSLVDWKKENLTYSRTGPLGASQFIDNLNLLLNRLDPLYTDALRRESLTVKFETECKSHLPFEHNVYMAVNDYLEKWYTELAQYLTLAAEIYAYNAEYGDKSTAETVSIKVSDLCKRIVEETDSDGNVTRSGQWMNNIDTYIDSRSYTKAYQNIKPDKINAMGGFSGIDPICIVTNTAPTKYMFGDVLPYGDKTPRSARAITQYSTTTEKGKIGNVKHWYFTVGQKSVNGTSYRISSLGAPKDYANSQSIQNFIQAMKTFNEIESKTGKSRVTLYSLLDQYLNISTEKGGKSLWFSTNLDYLFCGVRDGYSDVGCDALTYKYYGWGRFIYINKSDMSSVVANAIDVYDNKKPTANGKFVVLMVGP